MDAVEEEVVTVTGDEARTLEGSAGPGPACRLCGVALAGPLSILSLLLGVRRSPRNPNLCNRCAVHLREGVAAPVTVLFADLAGFTALTRELGPARAHRLADQFLRRATAILHRHDAMIDKYIGDAVMAVFNAPIRRDDHPRMAIAAALEIQAATAALGDEVGRPLAANIGVAVGDAHFGRLGSDELGSFTVIGDVVNLAARFESAAEPGEIVCGEAVFAAIAGALDDGAAPPAEAAEVKGYDEPVALRRLRADAGLRERLRPIAIAPASRRRFGIAASIAAALAAPCAGFYLFSPIVYALGYGAIFESAAVLAVDQFFDDGPARLTLTAIALGSALLCLVVVVRARLRRRRDGAGPASYGEGAQERRLLALAALSLMVVGFEHYVHVVLYGKALGGFH
ncbi:MAG: adenylate/guanylate cyclase domain-containing protein [Nannocystaceae bacterium]